MICNKCKKELEVTDFGKDLHNKDGLKKTCKICCRVYFQTYYQRHKKLNPIFGYERVKQNRLKWSKLYGVTVGSIAHHGLRVARVVFAKYEHKCDLCGSVERLSIHHMDGKGRNYQEKGLKPNNEINNLQLLCARCHGSIHGKVGGKMRGKNKI